METNMLELILLELREFKGSTNERFDKIDERFEKVDERLDKLDEKIDRTAQELNEKIDTTTQQLNEKIDKVYREIIDEHKDFVKAVEKRQKEDFDKLSNIRLVKG